MLKRAHDSFSFPTLLHLYLSKPTGVAQLATDTHLFPFESWDWHMSPRVRTRHGEVTAELAWSGSGSRSEITPAVGRTVHYPPPPLPTSTYPLHRYQHQKPHTLIATFCTPLIIFQTK
ncbi:hypothetical protein Hanom_Chr16g01439121 [Helianthus anomalus]